LTTVEFSVKINLWGKHYIKLLKGAFCMDEQQFYSPEDIEKSKVVSALAYLGILFFLPLVAYPESQFGRFHANQGLLLLIFSAAGNIILGIIPIIGWILLPFFGIAVLVYFILGLVNALNGQAKELPLIGKIRIIK
jgi:uncharacterized membrane protein